MPTAQPLNVTAAAALCRRLSFARDDTGQCRTAAGFLLAWWNATSLAGLMLLAAVPSSMARAADAAADLRAVVLRSYAACDASMAANDLDKCAAFRAEDYKQVNVEGQVRTSAQVDGDISMIIGGHNPLKQVTKIDGIRLLDDASAIVRMIQTSSQVEGGDEIRNKRNSRWKAWDTAERIVVRKWRATGDQRWERRDGTWRLVEARILSFIIGTRVAPAPPSSIPPSVRQAQ